MNLQRLIQQEKKKLIYIKLNLPPEVASSDSPRNYSQILRAERWIWAEKTSGLPLLEMDFRYPVYSLSLLSLDVANVDMDVVLPNPNCFHNSSIEERIIALHDVIRRAVGKHATLKSSVCFSRLASDESHDDYYVQYRCCDITQPTKYQRTNETYTCDDIMTEHDGLFQTILYVAIFLISPLLIVILPSEPLVYSLVNTDLVVQQKHKLCGSFRHSTKDGATVEMQTLDRRDSLNNSEDKPTGKEKINNPGSTDKSVILYIDDEDDDGNKDTVSQNHTDSKYVPVSTCESSGEMVNIFVPLDNSTPVRISHPFRYLFLLTVNNHWVCRLRRLVFLLLLYPGLMVLMVLVDGTYHHEEVSFLHQVESQLHICGKITDLELFDHFWLGTVFVKNEFYFLTFTGCMYILSAILISLEGSIGDMMEKLMMNDDYLGFMKLPNDLRTPETDRPGFLRLYHKMTHRLALVAEVRFWKFWLGGFKDIFQRKSGESVGVGFVLMVPLKFLLHFLSLGCLLPLFNMFPWEYLWKHIRQVQTKEHVVAKVKEANNRLFPKDDAPNKKGKHICFVLLILVAVIVMGFGATFALRVFLRGCKISTLVVLYTLRGLIKNYAVALPAVTIAFVALFYFLSVTQELENFYLDLKKTIFEKCVQKQKEEDDKHAKGGSKEGESKPRALVVYKSDGTPLIPKKLYKAILENHAPLRTRELAAITKLVLIATFLVYVATVIDAFGLSDVTNLGQALIAFMAATLPRTLAYFGAKNTMEKENMKYLIQYDINTFYENQPKDVVLHRQ